MDKFLDVYNLILHSNLLNFAVFLAIIIFICKKIDITSIIENMRNKVISKINDSDKNLKDAQKSKTEAVKSVKNTETEINNINTVASEKAKVLKEQVLKDTESKVQYIRNNAEKIISSEEKAIKSLLISNIGVKSVEIAKAQIIKELENNKILHNKFIEESIEELNKAVLNDIS